METIEHVVRQPIARKHETPLLLLHGAWHGAWCWQNWLDHFTSLGYEVHAISLPGHGQSSLNKGHINLYSFRDYVETLARQVKTISPTPVVVGHSLGGAILQKYLAKNQLPGAVLLAALPARGIVPMFLRLARRHSVPILWGALTLNAYRWVGTPALVQDLFLEADTAVDLNAFHQQLVRESFLVALRLLLPFAGEKMGQTPVLALAGEADNVFTVAEEKATAKKYGAECIVFSGQPHNLMMSSAWLQVAEAIDAWITNTLRLP